MLLEEALMFKDEVTALVRKFADTGPFTSDWSVKGKNDHEMGQGSNSAH